MSKKAAFPSPQTQPKSTRVISTSPADHESHCQTQTVTSNSKRSNGSIAHKTTSYGTQSGLTTGAPSSTVGSKASYRYQSPRGTSPPPPVSHSRVARSPPRYAYSMPNGPNVPNLRLNQNGRGSHLTNIHFLFHILRTRTHSMLF